MSDRMTKANFLAAMKAHPMTQADRNDGTIRLRIHTQDDTLGNANTDYLIGRYGNVLQFKRLYGGVDVWIDPDLLPQTSVKFSRLLDDIDRAADYPVLNDDLYETMRHEEALEAWGSYLADDARGEILAYLKENRELCRNIYDSDLFFDWLADDDNDDLMWAFPHAFIESDSGGSFLSGRQDDLLKEALERFDRRLEKSQPNDLVWLMTD